MRERLDQSEPAFLRSDSSGGTAAPILLRAPLRVFLSGLVVRYLLAAMLGLLGALAFTGAIAGAIEPFLAESPALSWLYGRFSVAGVARLIGIVELAAAVLLLASPLSRALSFAGSLIAVATFAVSLSLLVTTPGAFVHIASFPLPVPSVMGAFFMKDVFPFLAACWSLLDASRALRR